MVAILKPKKLRETQGYRPISLLCVPFKILEQASIYARIEPIVDPLLPGEQADFDMVDDTDQVALLTQGIEDSFSAEKAGAVFVDLTAACNTVWHRGFTLAFASTA